MLIVDAHLDLGAAALYWNRDLTSEVAAIRAREAGLAGKGLGANTVSLPEMQRGRVALALGTLLTRTGGSPASQLPKRRNQAIAFGMAQGQLAYYRALHLQGKARLVGTVRELDDHWAAWEDWEARCGSGETTAEEPPPPGLIVSMEGADAILEPEQAHAWWDDGLRVVGLTHYGASAYAHGTGSEGGLTPRAKPLLREMRARGMILDVTHLTDESFWEALELWDGPVLASHNNCRAIVPGERQFSDAQLRAIVQRGGIVGGALDAWMLHPDWVRGETSPNVVGLEALVDHIEHICDLAGDTRHAAIGSDLDGGFGAEQTPRDLDTIADLQKLPALMAKRGFEQRDVEAIMHGNWLGFFRDWLPGGSGPR